MAATDGGRVIRNAPYRASFVCTDNNGSPQGGLTGLVGSVSRDFVALEDPSDNTPGEVGTSGLAYIDLTVAEMTFSNQLHCKVIPSNSNTSAAEFVLTGEPCLDSGVIQSSPSSTSSILRASASAVANLYAGSTIEIVRGTGAGQVRTITVYNESSKTVTIDRAWLGSSPDSTSVYIIHPVVASSYATVGLNNSNVTQLLGETTALTVMTELYNGAIKASVSDASSITTTDFDGSTVLIATADYYNRCFLVFTTGVLQGLMRPISDYSSGRNIVFDATDAWPVVPTDGDEFVIISYRA